MPNQTWNSPAYRYGFNGKEKDQNGEFGLTHYDYGFRIYNPAIAKFLSVDPLTRSYPELTPYQFASNRPIDGIDLDGLEFSKSTFVDKTGKTHIHITVKINIDISTEIGNEKLIESYKNEAKKQFSQVLGDVYDPTNNIQYSGSLEYSEGATIVLSIDDPVTKENKNDLAIVGMSFPGYIGVASGVTIGENTELYSPVELAETIVHEVLHQGGVLHPTEEKAAEDVRLTRKPIPYVPNSYNTTILTTREIYNNIMLYNLYDVNDKNVGDVRKSKIVGQKVTPGQIKKINDNIDKGKVNGEPIRDL